MEPCRITCLLKLFEKIWLKLIQKRHGVRASHITKLSKISLDDGTFWKNNQQLFLLRAPSKMTGS